MPVGVCTNPECPHIQVVFILCEDDKCPHKEKEEHGHCPKCKGVVSKRDN